MVDASLKDNIIGYEPLFVCMTSLTCNFMTSLTSGASVEGARPLLQDQPALQHGLQGFWRTPGTPGRRELDREDCHEAQHAARGGQVP